MFSIIRSGFFLPALLVLAIPIEAQVSPAVPATTAAISGHVTHSGQPVPGVSIILEPADSRTARASLPRTITNEQGNYRLAAVPEGRYVVRPIAPAFILASGPDSDKAGTGASSGLGLSGFVVSLARGDVVEGIDFALEAGGVVTGRVIDDAGRPGVALGIECQRLNEQGQLIGASSARFETDDRGIYRIYGLPTGKYQVAVSGWDKSGSKPYLRTFHPDSTDPKRAELVEVTAGVESSGIDIRLGHPQQFFSITGRLIDHDTGKPVSGVTINVNGENDGRTGFATTNDTGTFKIENCVLGSYEVKIATTGGQTQGYYSDPVIITVSDADVTDLEINAVRGARVSGSVIVVGSKDPTLISAFAQSAMIATNLQPGVRGSAWSVGATVIDPVGRFELTGLRPGKFEIRPSNLPQGFTLLRIEYNGSPVRDGLTVSAGERITGVRVLVTYGTGSIRGEIKVEGGTLPTRMGWFLTIRRVDGDGEVRSEMIDARGRFWLTDLAPGQYEITAEADYVEIPGVTPKPYPGPIKQTVAVVNKSESQVLLVLALGK
jgi:5-hydroxyisourate hydrolase-like protein (transthyretin family)